MGGLTISCFVIVLSITVYYLPKLFEPKLLPIVEGFFQPEFMDVAQMLRRNMESGQERGASFVVYHDGVPVIDMWAGYADRESQRRWRNDTTTMAFGCTNGVMAVVIALMVDKGVLNYSRPVADYWPQFGVNGKENITVEMLLSHTAGLPYLSEPISLWDLTFDMPRVQELLSSQTPVWTPGSKVGHHIHTYGLYLDRLLEKVNHKDSTAQVLQSITDQFGIEFDMNLKPEDVYKTARMHTWNPLETALFTSMDVTYLRMLYKYMFSNGSIASRTFGTVKEYTMPISVFNNPEMRGTTLSSLTGTGTARGLAKLYSILATGGSHQGRRLLKEETVRQLSTGVASGDCEVTGLPLKYGRGVQLFKNPFGDDTFGHGGYGGQVVIADPVYKLSIAYLTNYLSMYTNADDPRFLDLQRAVYKNIDVYTNRLKRLQHGQ